MDYMSFLKSKLITSLPVGFECRESDIPERLYPFQKDLVRWACMRGKAALFTMTGTGKTAMQVSWAEIVHRKTNGPVLILAPLAVSKQTVHEARKFGIDVTYCREGSHLNNGVNIANYEILHHFDGCNLEGIVLDESSILKSFSGKTRNAIIERSMSIPYRLACTATPAPNDYMELGNHSEFLGVMSYSEMLATFFVHDGGDTSKWRLKGHAEDRFYEWISSWGVFLNTPSDLGYSDDGFILPELKTVHHTVESKAGVGYLFPTFAKDLISRRNARRESIQSRIEKCTDIVSQSEKPFLVWCDLNAESEGVTRSIPGAIEITGSNSNDHKEKMMLEFAAGNIPVMVTKPDIAGFGMNWQVCHNTAFLGLSDSFESMFQATKRFHRHGQNSAVTRHIITSEAEGNVIENVLRKEEDFTRMIANMVEHTKKITMGNIKHLTTEKIEYKAEKKINIPSWLSEFNDYQSAY